MFKQHKLHLMISALVLLMGIHVSSSLGAELVVKSSAPSPGANSWKAPSGALLNGPLPPPVNLYFVSKDLSAESFISQMVCKIKPTEPAPECHPGDLKITENQYYISKSQNNFLLPNNVVSWTSPCPDASNYVIRSVIICASMEAFLQDVTLP